ncbi:MAG: hypothetical protein IJG16_07785 [Clostridia bacterium]|nr:hypothetical protein [Clostridia bacterium]
MSEEEIIKSIVDELTEHSLQKYRDELAAEGSDYNAELVPLSKEVDKILAELPPEYADTVNAYITKCALVAEKDCSFLYIQGAKDCVKLLKALGVI